MNERIAVIKFSHSPMKVVWDERGEADGRPWTLNIREELHDWWCRYKPESIIELTDVPKMVLQGGNLDEVLTFMGVPQDLVWSHFLWAEIDGPTKIRIGSGTRVWKHEGRCYILGPHSSVFQVWTMSEELS